SLPLPGYKLPRPINCIVVIISIPFVLFWVLIRLPWLVKDNLKEFDRKKKQYGFNPENIKLCAYISDETKEIRIVGNKDGLLRLKAEIEDYITGNFEPNDHWHWEDLFEIQGKKGLIIGLLAEKGLNYYYAGSPTDSLDGSTTDWTKVSEGINNALEKGKWTAEFTIIKDNINLGDGLLSIEIDQSGKPEYKSV
ncbi:MAG: hypothetical protein V1709_09015, partial [Planctomycetota bacterium]